MNDPAKRINLPKQDRRASILKGAAKAFAQAGFESTSLEDIAHEAKVSRALLYRHFDTKRAIYEAILKHMCELLPGDRPVPAATTMFDARLRPLIEAAQAEPNAFRLLFRHAIHEPAFRAYAESQNAFRQQYIADKLSPLIVGKERRQFTAALLRDTTLGVLLAWIDNGMPDPDHLQQLLQRLITDILKSMETPN